MPIIPGTMGIKTWSFEHVITSDGDELCEQCAIAEGWDIDSADVSPIFADTEMDRESICDKCENVSDLHTIIGEWQ